MEFYHHPEPRAPRETLENFFGHHDEPNSPWRLPGSSPALDRVYAGLIQEHSATRSWPLEEVHAGHGAWILKSPGSIEPTYERRPIQHLYRGVSQQEFDSIQRTGYIQSDGRGVIAHDEGTNAATQPYTAHEYLPVSWDKDPNRAESVGGYILKLQAHPADGWRLHNDSYARTSQRVPFGRVTHIMALGDVRPLHSAVNTRQFRPPTS